MFFMPGRPASAALKSLCVAAVVDRASSVQEEFVGVFQIYIYLVS